MLSHLNHLRMASDLNLLRVVVNQYQQNPPILSHIPGPYAIPPVNWSQGSAGVAFMQNNSSSGLVGSTNLVWSVTSPPSVIRSVSKTPQTTSMIWAQASKKILKMICETIQGNVEHWHLALDFTPNKRCRTACRQELPERIVLMNSEKLTLLSLNFSMRVTRPATSAGELQSREPSPSVAGLRRHAAATFVLLHAHPIAQDAASCGRDEEGEGDGRGRGRGRGRGIDRPRSLHCSCVRSIEIHHETSNYVHPVDGCT
jgi:hypothetical protein